LTPIIITGIGTGVGKTLVSAIITEALQADYWKPIQAGYQEGTDSDSVKKLIANKNIVIHPELFRLKLAASPHIAAREEGVEIDLDNLKKAFHEITAKVKDRENSQRYLIIEGAGGLMVPLNEKDFVLDLIKKLDAKVILVSRNYLGSINHSLLTAQTCKSHGLQVLGWVFNDQYLNYENEIVQWSGIPKIASIPFCENIDKAFVINEAQKIRNSLLEKC
jgi:dethiobiotin synthetase